MVGYRWYDEKKIEAALPIRIRAVVHDISSTATWRFPRRPSSLPRRRSPLISTSPTQDRAPGTEVAQVYLALPSLPDVPQPPRQLKGFARVTVDAGKTAHAHVTLDARAFSYWDVATPRLESRAGYLHRLRWRFVPRLAAQG